MPLIAEIPRAEFLGCYFDYQPGEHVVYWEPTQQGKTKLMYQMLNVAIAQNPHLSTVSMCPKSVDPATRRASDEFGLKIVDRWPAPPRLPGAAKPPGYVLWPKHLPTTMPVKERRAYLAAIFRQALARQLAKGNSISAIDDAYQMCVILGLNMDVEEILTIGGGAGAGGWITGQKASGTRQGTITSFALNSPTHLVLGHDPYAANQRRLDEISGVDMHLVRAVVPKLRKHRIRTPYGYKNISEKLYIRKDGPYMAIVLP